ncbi:hypothetical protein [Candidatus Hepatoplasma crinochetorum]|uniref:hypothetical protein n=1 Tax=Candidatus Hepatoplasma crinochetorum TaxID=295596 RepID=UPI003085400B|nr:MAG: hypothetical protein HCTKY_2430 [Candidatus Hepatoplasma crinochetorum]
MEIEIEFFTWIRKIEFNRLKEYYIKNNSKDQKTNQNEINLLKIYLDSKVIFEKYDNNEFSELSKKFSEENNIEEIRNKIKKEVNINKRREIEKKNKEILKVDDTINFIKDYLSTLTNQNYNKMRKHKILYFMNAFAINLNKSTKLWKNNQEIFNLFFAQFDKNKSIEWCAFENGPILKNIYHTGLDDNLFFKIEENKLIIFEIAYFLLREFSTLQLVKESHKTNPWEKNYNPNIYYAKIPTKEMIEFFEKNRPFFAKTLEY